MMKKSATILAALGLSAALVLAQGPGPGRGRMGGTPPDPQTMIQKRVNFLATLLTLTDAQKTQATTIFTNAYTASQSLHTNMQSARQSLSAAVKKNDTGAIDQLSATLGTLSGQLTAIESKAGAAFYAILTPDQQAKYDTLPHHGPRGGPGAMMRMPRPSGQ